MYRVSDWCATSAQETKTYITWQLDFRLQEYQKNRHEDLSDDGVYVYDSNFQFKIVSKDSVTERKLVWLYFKCSKEVYINYVKCTHQRISDNFVLIAYEHTYNSIQQPNVWVSIVTLERLNNTLIIFEISKNNNLPFMLDSRLCNDFNNLLHFGSFSDAIMKSADGEEYKVHKALLTCRSPVLKAHFEHNTNESITNIVETSLESEVLNEVITFIYTDQAPNVAMMPEKLLVAANYYHLDRLKGLSEKALCDKLTVDNALETLQLAQLYFCENLKYLTLQFIKKEAKLVTKTEAWAKMDSSELLKTIVEFSTKE